MTESAVPMRRRRFIWIAVGAVVLLLLALAFSPDTLTVETAAVARGPVSAAVTAEGRTRVRDRFIVAAPVTGTLERITLDPGDAVDRQAVVARITPASAALLDSRTRAEAESRVAAAAAGLRQAEAAVVQARSDRAFAARELDRARQLAAAGALAPRAVEEAEQMAAAREAAATSAEEAVRAARADVQAARASVAAPGTLSSSGAVNVRSPSGGQILRVVERGPGLVQAGTPLVEVGDAGALELVADLLTQDAERVAAGAPATITVGGAERPARVRRVEPSAVTKISALGVEEQRVDVVLEFTDEPATEAPRAPLGDNFRVDVRIVTAERADALSVPTSALFRDGDGWAVFTVRDGRAARQRVDLGIRGESSAEVVAGLTAGDLVVLYPGDEVRDGVRVRTAN